MIRVLSVLLVLQLAVTIALYWPREAPQGAASALVPDTDMAAVSELVISGDDAEVLLTRAGAGWMLESGMPADSVKVDTLLRALLESDPGYAIANSDSAAGRFEVAEANYQRRVTLTLDGGSSRSVYIGSSPAFRKVHARAEGSSDIHVIELNSYDAPTGAASWLDRGLLAMDNVDALLVADRRFSLIDDAWEDEDGDAADAEAAENLVQALSALQVSGLATAEDQALAEAGNLALELTVNQREEAATFTLRENDGRHFIRSSRYEPLFTISNYDAERVIDAANRLAGIAEDAAGPEGTGI